MRAQLARHVQRRATVLRASRLTPRLSLVPGGASSASHTSSLLASAPSRTQRRTFLGILQKAPREIKKPEYEPGWAIILQFRNNMLDEVRPPSMYKLVGALRDFFKYKRTNRVALNSTQAKHTRNLFNYLFENKGKEVIEGFDLYRLLEARSAVLQVPKEANTSEHLELSKALYREILIAREMDDGTTPEVVDEKGQIDSDYRAYIRALALYGGSKEAHSDLMRRYSLAKEAGVNVRILTQLITENLHGLAKEDDAAYLESTAKELLKAGMEYNPKFKEIMTAYYAEKNMVQETKQWFSKRIARDAPTTIGTYKAILPFSARNEQTNWSLPIFQKLIESNPTKKYWDLIYKWSVLCMGKSLDDMRQMFEVVNKNSAGDASKQPDVDTINGLIECAIELNDAYMAERIPSLAASLDISLNARSYILLLESRMQAKDLFSAQSTYKSLAGAEVTEDEDLPVINKYIRLLCNQTKPDLKFIREILDVLEQRSVTLEPDTVVALCAVYLKQDQHFDVIDTLSVNIFQHSLDQRESIRSAFISFCTDPNNSTARVWDAYSILRQFFLETSVVDRAKIMQTLFDRKRPDMAVHVFGHMRQHSNSKFRPTADTYAQCLEGLGRHADVDSKEHVDLVHNMLKMDTSMRMSIKLYNGLMMAYVACEEPSRAMEFWDEIDRSADGPSYNSLEIAFFVCEKLPHGDKRAKEIWGKLEKLDVDVPASVYSAYVGALAGNGDVKATQEAIDAMKKATGSGPTPETLIIPHNALPGPTLKQQFTEWARLAYPETWEEVQSRRDRRFTEPKYNLTRHLTT